MKNNLLKKILEKSREEKIFINVYSDSDNIDKFSMGIVKGFDDDFTLLKRVSPEGNYDGLSILLNQYIYCIEFEDNYIKRKQSLIKDEFVNKQLEEEVILSSNFRFDKAIEIFKEQNYLCSINLIYDRTLIGYINESDYDYVMIKNVDDNHKEDGFSIFKIMEVESINVFSINLQSISN